MKKNLVLLACFLVALGQAGNVIYLPSLPYMTHDLLATPVMVTYSLFLYLIGFSFTQLVSGPLSDKIGRKPVILAGIVLYFVASCLIAQSHSIGTLLVLRIIQGIGTGCFFNLARAVINDTHDGNHLVRAISYTSIAVSITSMLSPTIGGYVQHHLTWHYDFWILAVCSFAVFIFALIVLQETNPYRQNISWEQSFREYGSFIKNKYVMAYLINAALVFGTLMTYYAASPYIFQGLLHLSPITYGYLFFATSICFILGSLTNAYWPYSRLSLLVAGNFIHIIAIFVFTAFVVFKEINFMTLFFPLLVMIYAVGAVLPAGITEAIAPYKHMAGKASALVGFFQFLFSAAGTLAIALLPKTNPLSLANVLIIMGIVSIGFSAAQVRHYFQDAR